MATNTNSRVEAEGRKHIALTRLASARREKLNREDFDVYLDGLKGEDAATVEHVCEQLGLIAPSEFEPRFPPLHVVLRECRLRRQYLADQRQARLPQPESTPHISELPAGKFDEFMARVRRAIGKHSMPAAQIGERE